jgi:hypothetical protein
MTNQLPYKTLILCVAASFAATLTVYAIRAPNPITSRVPFAVLVSVFPGALTWAVFRWTRLSRSRWNAVSLYVIWFVVVMVVQGWIRTW